MRNLFWIILVLIALAGAFFLYFGGASDSAGGDARPDEAPVETAEPADSDQAQNTQSDVAEREEPAMQDTTKTPDNSQQQRTKLGNLADATVNTVQKGSKAVGNTAKKAGAAVKKGAENTGDAISNTYRKLFKKN